MLLSAAGPDFPMDMTWEHLTLLSLVLVIELVHRGSSSILKVTFFGTPCRCGHCYSQAQYPHQRHWIDAFSNEGELKLLFNIPRYR